MIGVEAPERLHNSDYPLRGGAQRGAPAQNVSSSEKLMDPQWQFNPLLIPLALSATVLIVLILMGLRQRQNPVALPFVVFNICLLIWILTSLWELATLNLRLSLIAADLSFIAITLFPLAWLGLVMTYNGQGERFRQRLAWLLVIPLLTNLVIATNPLHHLWRGDSYRDLTSTWFPISIYNYGPWFYVVHAPYSYLLTAIAFFMLLRSLALRERAYRYQLLTLLAAFVLPLLTDVIYVLGVSPIPHYNLAPVTFSISGLMVGWTLLGFRFLDLTPIARDLVLENMEDLVVVLDTQDRVVDVNPAARQRLFDGARNLVGKALIDLRPECARLIANPDFRREVQQEIRLVRDGEPRIFDVRLSVITRRPDIIAGQLLLLRDITERKAAEEALQQINTELQERNEELDAFSYTVAHDLKNPLAVLMGHAEILTAQTTGTQQHSAERISQAAMKLNNIIDDLLMLAQVGRRDHLELNPLKMNEIIAEALDRQQAMANFGAARISLPDSWPEAVGYAPWVEEIWANYLSNAIKYGGIPPVIDLGWDQQGEAYRFWVKDNGPGLSASAKGRLFQQFERLDSQRIEGHGLGLSIVRRIAERLGGEAGFESNPGAGSCFYFTLRPAELPAGRVDSQGRQGQK